MASFMKIFPRTYTNFQFFQRGAWPLSESPPFEYSPARHTGHTRHSQHSLNLKRSVCRRDVRRNFFLIEYQLLGMIFLMMLKIRILWLNSKWDMINILDGIHIPYPDIKCQGWAVDLLLWFTPWSVEWPSWRQNFTPLYP